MDARGAANVHGTHDEADGAVKVDGDHATGLEASVHPVTGGDAAALVFAFHRGLVVVVVAGRFQAFHEPNAPGHRPFDAAGAFLGGIEQAELYGVYAKLLAQFVHHCLHTEGGLRRAGGAVGGGLGLVDHHVVAVHLAVLHVVAGEGAGHGLHHRRTGVGSGVHRHFELHGGQAAVVLGAHLNLHPRTGRRA